MEEQSNSTRDSVMQAALELFAEKGFHDTSIAAIAKRAGVGKGTLYWYFSSKEELFRLVVTEKSNTLFLESSEILEKVIHGTMSPEDGLKAFIRFKMKFMAENRELSQIILNIIQYSDDDLKCRLFTQHKKLLANLKAIIQNGVDKGSFRPQFAQEIAVAIVGITNSIGSMMFFQNITDPTEMIEFIYEMTLYGIRNYA